MMKPMLQRLGECYAWGRQSALVHIQLRLRQVYYKCILIRFTREPGVCFQREETVRSGRSLSRFL